jgi:Copper amine oxidase N-terminal domain
MPLLRYTALMSSLALMLGIGAASVSAQPAGAPPPDFGTPPSGEIPILFNDHHVYAKPDRLKANRVLAALVRGNTILIPLRSMFEQMGATVSYDPASKTADVSKPGSDVKVTVGRPEVVINGESRPLDVPPEIYKGSVVVPVRVISEGMGAYVQWVPDRRIVVVRYVAAAPPTPPPPPPPPATAPPTPPPTPTPTPTPRPKPPYDEKFIVGDYIVKPTVTNEFSGNNVGNIFVGSSFAGRAGFEFSLAKIHLMVEADGRQYQYKHVGFLDNITPRNTTCGPALAGEPGCVTTIGGRSSVYVPSFLALDRDIDARLGLRFSQPRLYIVASYYWHNTNYGYPQLHGPGFGLEKLPDLDRVWSPFGSYFYYPNANGAFSDPTTRIGYNLTYKVQKYEAGMTVRMAKIGGPASVFLEGGFIGDRGDNKFFAPAGFRHYGGFAGIGVNF